jgi:hypothetical protein
MLGKVSLLPLCVLYATRVLLVFVVNLQKSLGAELGGRRDSDTFVCIAGFKLRSKLVVSLFSITQSFTSVLPIESIGHRGEVRVKLISWEVINKQEARFQSHVSSQIDQRSPTYCFLFFAYTKFAATGTNPFTSAQFLTPPSFSPIPQCLRSFGFERCNASVVPFFGANTRNT